MVALLRDALDAFGGSFDLVTMWDVLEHLTDPGSVLATASQGLAERGRLVLLTPAMGTVYDRVGGKRGNRAAALAARFGLGRDAAWRNPSAIPPT